MVKDGGALARAPRLVQERQRVRSLCGCGWWHSLSGITRRGGNNDRLSSLWREVISLAGAAMSFSSSGSKRTGAVRSRSYARHSWVMFDRIRQEPSPG